MDTIGITMKEMEIINSFQYKAHRKVLFTMLAIAKHFNSVSETNNGWVNYNTKSIFRMADVSVSRKAQNFMIHDFYKAGVVEIPRNSMNLNLRITFVDESDAAIHCVESIEDCGLSYLSFCGERVKACADCGRLFKPTSSHNQYCKRCLAKSNDKVMYCVSCGKKLILPSTNHRTIRCDECQNRENQRIKNLSK